jgi:hypothetical protein
MYTTAGYLLNCTPHRSLNWSTPFEKAYGKQPSLAHLSNFGCRAFALRKHIKCTNKLSSRATIGYLVGYDSRNIFRIWIPKASSRGHQAKVIRTRDVTFDESTFFPSDDDQPEQAELKAILNLIELPEIQSKASASDSSESEHKQDVKEASCQM